MFPIPAKEVLDAEVKHLRTLLTSQDEVTKMAKDLGYQIGDQLVRMLDPKGQFRMTLAQILSFLVDPVSGQPLEGCSRTRLMGCINLASRIPANMRLEEVDAKTAENIVRIANEIESNAKKELGEAAKDFKVDIAAEMQRAAEQPKGKKTTRGSVRNLAKNMSERARNELLPLRHAAAEAAMKDVPAEIVGQCHCKDYAEILSQMPDASVQIVYADPPYAHYTKTENGMLDFSTSAANADAKNITEDDALRTTCDLFPLAAKKLRKDGVILLWQAGRHLRVEIIQAAESEGFEIGLPLVWDKIKPQPGDLRSATQISTEFCWIIQRKGEKPWRKSDLSRAQVWAWEMVQHSSTSIHETHLFEKPMQSNLDLLNLYSGEGDLVFDAFGCTGGMAVAAIRSNRKWVYCELHEGNFKLGYSRIQAERSKSSDDLQSETLTSEDNPEASLVAA